MPSTRADVYQRDEARERVEAAEAGDPRAVREILRALEEFLRGRDSIPRSYSVFCADSFTAFLDDDRAWEPLSADHDNWPDPAEEFKTRDRSKDSPVERILGLGARLSVRRLRRIGMAACRAFHLTRSRTHAAARATIDVSEEESSPRHQTIRFLGYFDIAATRVVRAAHTGDPRALRAILRAVEHFLDGGRPLAGSVAFFCADALKQWIAELEPWERIENYVRQAGPGSKPPINDLRPLGRSFCRAFHLSRPKRLPKPGETPQEVGFCPPAVYKLECLLQHGVSWRRAVAIVTGAFPSHSSWTLGEWARLIGLKSGAVGEGTLPENCLRLAAQVLRETAQGRSLEEAYLEAARWLARRVFPSHRSRLERWAARVLRDAELGHRRPEEHRKLAQRIHAASQQGQPLPAVPEKVSKEISPEVRAEKADTFLPDTLIPELIPAVRKAHDFGLEMVERWPQCRAPDMAYLFLRRLGLEDEPEGGAREACLKAVEDLAEGVEGAVGAWIGQTVEAHHEAAVLGVGE
jgi:hypothetical protein